MIGVELLVEIQFLARQGLNKTQIARRLGVDRKTVRKSLALDVDEFVKNPAKWPSILDPYKRYLQYRLEMLPELSAVRLYREISTLSCPGGKGAELLPDIPYQGSERTVRRYVSEIRPRNARVYRPIETLPGNRLKLTGVTSATSRLAVSVAHFTPSPSFSVTHGFATLSLPRPRTWSHS